MVRIDKAIVMNDGVKLPVNRKRRIYAVSWKGESLIEGRRVWRRVLWASIFALALLSMACYSLVRIIAQELLVSPLWLATFVADGLFVLCVTALTLIPAWRVRSASLDFASHSGVYEFSGGTQDGAGSFFGVKYGTDFVGILGCERTRKLWGRLLIVVSVTTLIGVSTAATMLFGFGSEGVYSPPKVPVFSSPGSLCAVLIAYGWHAVWAIKRIELLRFSGSLKDVEFTS